MNQRQVGGSAHEEKHGNGEKRVHPGSEERAAGELGFVLSFLQKYTDLGNFHSLTCLLSKGADNEYLTVTLLENIS